jgi:hypothetical protein
MLAARNDEALAEYGLFPTYPTAFIVAANTEIEVALPLHYAPLYIV